MVVSPVTRWIPYNGKPDTTTGGHHQIYIQLCCKHVLPLSEPDARWNILAAEYSQLL
jgi:hypothetical protein